MTRDRSAVCTELPEHTSRDRVRHSLRECLGVLRRDLGLAMFGEEIIEGLRHNARQRVPFLDGENLQLVAHLFRKMHGDGARDGLLLRPW